ncbi:hypothetical protein Sulku_2760 (plasmid) [Sulfuricurvum kujiense DSM 16994]|uniref:Uncharacterized protein n=1 Tax=Sulfuricurvum kujiense (strain ATCC BAA-921 / DSM 16994 / JCM 11577 / YK-1) TaxID=709032 RepID=E4U3Z3_SULKY|nr:hypothetical protein Sulku_2760 [Sulfuricurvum kujiense DSM 16994]
MIKRLFKKLFGSRSKHYKEYHITNLAFGCIE